MPVSVNHTQNADRRGKHLVVECVGEATQQNTSETAANDRVTKGSFLDHGHRFVNRGEELLSSGQGSIEIPLKGGDDLITRDLANSKATHLRKFLPEFVPDV